MQLERLEDDDDKLSFEADKVGPGFGCTSPLQANRMYNQVTMQRQMSTLAICIVKQTFFEYLFPGVIRLKLWVTA